MAKIQIAEEPNLHNIPYVDCDSPNVRLAVIKGVIAAKEECKRHNLSTLVGFNGVPTFDPNNDFWRDLALKSDTQFYNAIDYVGLDFFPDVFRPIAFQDLKGAVTTVIKHFREVSLGEARIDKSIPIHITENGWATSPDRSYEKQAHVMDCIVNAINEIRATYNLTHYEHFSLRDANSNNPDFFITLAFSKTTIPQSLRLTPTSYWFQHWGNE